MFLMDSLEYESIKSVKESQPHLLSDFDPVFERALSRDPSARFPDIVAFAEALQEVCNKQKISPETLKTDSES